MQFDISQFDVSLAWALQAALTGGLALACIGLAVTFGRPAMRVLAANFVLNTAASAVIWVALNARSMGLEPRVGGYVAAFSLPLSPLLSTLLMLHLARLLAGRVNRRFPSSAAIAGTAVGGLTASLALAALTSHRPGGALGVVAAIASVVAVACYAMLTVVTFRLRATSAAHRNALGLFGASFAVMTVRSTVNIAVAALALANGTTPRFSLGVTVGQVFLLVVSGVLQIIAVLDEERASILHNAEQLRHAEAAVAQSHRLESLGRMAGAVAHDFNNVLAVIGLSAEAARATTDAERDADLNEILVSSKRGQELTRQLLAFARQTPQQVTRFDVNHQLDKLHGLLLRIVGKRAALTLSAAPTPQLVDMDVTQFEQVVMNLVVNARDSMPNGGTIAVNVEPTVPSDTANARFVRLTVTDTGTGIPPDVLPHIFEPFFSTKSAGEGTGLGLATCDGIVRRSAGRIDVTTDAGAGTRFAVLLPRATG